MARLELVSPSPRAVAGEGGAKRRVRGAAPDPDAMLGELVPELIAAEEHAAALRGLVDSWRRQLANKRGVAFIRPERVIEEFANG
jgi:hypothetical protein